MSFPLESLDHEIFAPMTGEVFTVTAGGVPVQLRLSEVKKLGHRRADASRDPFSLTFTGAQGLRLPQAIYPFSHETLGTLEMFIAQVGDGARGAEFEAIFT